MNSSTAHVSEMVNRPVCRRFLANWLLPKHPLTAQDYYPPASFKSPTLARISAHQVNSRLGSCGGLELSQDGRTRKYQRARASQTVISRMEAMKPKNLKFVSEDPDMEDNSKS